MRNYNLAFLSTYRNSIYAIATVWIAFFHTTINFNYSDFLIPISLIKASGYIGVDIFLFVSGVSLYFSFSKNPSISQFYKRRIKRIIIPSLLINIPYYAVTDLIIKPFKILSFLYDVTGINFFLFGTRILWFIVAILILYFIYPFLYKLFSKTNWSVFTAIALISASVIINIFAEKLFPSFWSKSEIFLCRIPIFLFGAYIGKFVKEGRILKIKNYHIFIISAICFAIIILDISNKITLTSTVSRYLSTIGAIPLTLLISLTGKIRNIARYTDFISACSLEIYLIQPRAIEIFTNIIGINHYIIINIVAIVITVTIALIIKRIEKLILNPRTNFKET